MSIHHHSLMVVSQELLELFDFARSQGFQQFAFLHNGSEWQLSAPLTPGKRAAYAWLYERQKESNTE